MPSVGGDGGVGAIGQRRMALVLRAALGGLRGVPGRFDAAVVGLVVFRTCVAETWRCATLGRGSGARPAALPSGGGAGGARLGPERAGLGGRGGSSGGWGRSASEAVVTGGFLCARCGALGGGAGPLRLGGGDGAARRFLGVVAGGVGPGVGRPGASAARGSGGAPGHRPCRAPGGAPCGALRTPSARRAVAGGWAWAGLSAGDERGDAARRSGRAGCPSGRGALPAHLPPGRGCVGVRGAFRCSHAASCDLFPGVHGSAHRLRPRHRVPEPTGLGSAASPGGAPGERRGVGGSEGRRRPAGGRRRVERGGPCGARGASAPRLAATRGAVGGRAVVALASCTSHCTARWGGSSLVVRDRRWGPAVAGRSASSTRVDGGGTSGGDALAGASRGGSGSGGAGCGALRGGSRLGGGVAVARGRVRPRRSVQPCGSPPAPSPGSGAGRSGDVGSMAWRGRAAAAGGGSKSMTPSRARRVDGGSIAVRCSRSARPRPRPVIAVPWRLLAPGRA